jgi:tellurite resistance protein
MVETTRARAARGAKRTPRKRVTLTLDQSIIAILIAAMDANQNVSPEEAVRAQHIIWSMRRFRHRSGETVDRLIETVRMRIEKDGVPSVLQRAARTIPARLRPSAFAVAVDLMLADTRLERAERQFVTHLASALRVRADLSAEILRVLMIKNNC